MKIAYEEVEGLLQDIPVLAGEVLRSVRNERDDWHSVRGTDGKCIAVRFNTAIISDSVIEVSVTDWDQIEEEPFITVDRVREIVLLPGINDSVEKLTEEINAVIRIITRGD